MTIADQLAQLEEATRAIDTASSQIGHIVSVTGSQAVAVLEREVFDGSGRINARVQIGSVVKIRTPRSVAIGLVSGMSVPVPSHSSANDELRVIELDLVGEIAERADGASMFRRGVSGIPSLADPVTLTDQQDLELVYNPQGRAFAQIGSLYQDERIAAHVLVDELLAKHFAVVGTTGSGKSCALAGILLSILSRHSHAHIVILDIHNEYAKAFGTMAELITPASLQLPYWLLNFEELVEVLSSADSHRDAEAEILTDAVVHAKRRYFEAAAARTGATGLRRGADLAGVTVESPTPFRLVDLVSYLDEQLGRLERAHSTLPYRRLKSRIETLTSDPRYSFMFGGLTVQDSMADILARIFRIPTEGRPVTVLDLSAVPSETLNVVISTLCRISFDLGVWSKGELPITLVCEEAHRYAPHDQKLGFQPTRRALARIAKEGRKYGVSLGLVTQRPSELDPTILSQCNTVFALRLSNEGDQQVIRAATSDNAMSLLNFLPSLGDGEAIAVGQGVALPMRIRFARLAAEQIPSNEAERFSMRWSKEAIDRGFLDRVVSRWRHARRDDD